MSDITREEVDAKLIAVEARIEARLANLEMIVKTGFAEIRAEMAQMRTDMRTEMSQLRVEMYKNTANLIKWGIGLAIAVVGLNVGLLTLISRMH